MVWCHNRNGQRLSTSTEDYLDWQRQNTVFQSLDAWAGAGFTVSTDEWTEEIPTTRCSSGFFDNLMGESTSLGRHFLPDESQIGKDHVVILNHSFWQQRFGGDPDIVGKSLRMNGESYTVVGVAAPNPSDKGESQMNVPLAFQPDEVNREGHWLLVLGRLKPGVSIAEANADMTVIAKRLAEAYPKTDADITVTVEPLKNDFLPASTRTGLWLMMGAVGFVLLIACVNIANLLLAWGTGRQKEIAIRAAHGATRARIFRQFLVESLALAAVGGVLGILLANTILSIVMTLMPRNDLGIPYEADPKLNIPVMLFTLGATILCGALFGSAPAWHAARQNVNEMLKEGGRSSAGGGHNRLRRGLVIAEFALAVILVAGAGLTIRSFWNVANAEKGIRTDHILTFSVPLRDGRKAEADQNFIQAHTGKDSGCAWCFTRRPLVILALWRRDRRLTFFDPRPAG